MRVCVTGGTGFIGGPLIKRLLAEGQEVRVLARPSARADQLEASGSTVIRGELADAAAISRAMESTEIVFHIAAKVNPPGTREEYFETNAAGTERLLRSAREGGVRKVVYLSSISVYGLTQDGIPIDEETSYDPHPELRDFYAQSKIAADRFAVSFAKSTGLSVVILRPGIIYGPGRRLPIGLMGFSIGGLDVTFGQPGLRVPLNFTENLLDAMQLVANQNVSGLREYIVVDDEELTLGEYHSVLAKFERKRIVFFPSRPLKIGLPAAEIVARALRLRTTLGANLQQVRRAMQDRWYVTRRLREETGWVPRKTLYEAMKETVDANHSARV